MSNAKSADRQPSSETRELMLDAAERLFAEHGLDAVSMRQINRVAGQRNTSSIHYHFGSREAVIEAIVERRMSRINESRLAMLAELEQRGATIDLRELVAAYIRPLATHDGGVHRSSAYVRFLAQAYASSQVDLERMIRGRWDQSVDEVANRIRARLLELPQAVFEQRLANLFRGVVHVLADREHDVEKGRRRARTLAFDDLVEDLIDTQTAAISAPGRPR